MQHKKENLVKEHYECLPYPPRDPQNEKKLLYRTEGDNLYSINHYGFAGKLDLSKGFRALVAGGGTGDAAIYLGEQLKKTNSEIIYIDLSSASRKVAEERAKIRKLKNIKFISDSLLNIPNLKLGQFDYINCSGVLHHLVNPVEGLQAINEVVKDEGLMFIMLYAQYGRDLVYRMQNLLRDMLPSDLSIPEKIRLTRKLLVTLPSSSIYQELLKYFAHDIDESKYGDSGLYDLLLHSIDRCYNVAQLYDFIKNCKLQQVHFIGQLSGFYSLENLNLSEFFDKNILEIEQQQDYAERIFSKHIKHQFYLTSAKNKTAAIEDPKLAIKLENAFQKKHIEFSNAMEPGKLFKLNYQIGNKKYHLEFMATEILKYTSKFFDGKTSIKSIIEKTKKICPHCSESEIYSEIISLYELLQPMGWCYLTKPKLSFN